MAETSVYNAKACIGRRPRGDEALARQMILEGHGRAAIAKECRMHYETIELLRIIMEGELGYKPVAKTKRGRKPKQPPAAADNLGVIGIPCTTTNFTDRRRWA